MANVKSSDLGALSIDKLLIRQSIPAGIGVLVMSLNIVVDTIFVGNWIGSTAIAAVNVVLPVSFFIAALGMAIGVGGSSIISRALGANRYEKALKTFGNQITLTLLLCSILVILGFTFVDQLIPAFGGKGNIFEPAKIFYTIILYGVPIQALTMMGNTAIRAEGKPKYAMIAMIIPSVANILGDYVLIKYFDMGMAGAAWASTGSFVLSFFYNLWFFLSDKSELKISLSHFGLNGPIIKEMGALGFVTLSRQAVKSVMYLLVNNILFNLGGESSVAVFAVIGRMLMFSLFPVLGVMQGFLPIAGFNYGARKFDRVRLSINKAILYACILALFIFGIIQLFPGQIAGIFTKDSTVIENAPRAMHLVFLAIPIVGFQIIGSAYFQAIGKARPAFFLTLTRQGWFFIPLVLILPHFYGLLGVWLSFCCADVLATLTTAVFLNREVRLDLKPKEKWETHVST